MGIDYNDILQRYQEGRINPPYVHTIVAGMVEHHKIPRDVALAAVYSVLTDVYEGVCDPKDSDALWALILGEALRLKEDAEHAATLVLANKQEQLAQRTNRQAIEDSYLVADEAAEAVRGARETQHRAEETARNYRHFIESPPLTRAWRAFRGKA